jgi:ABC-type nickel/cobalt efflux system permease component RcnA
LTLPFGVWFFVREVILYAVFKASLCVTVYGEESLDHYRDHDHAHHQNNENEHERDHDEVEKEIENGK